MPKSDRPDVYIALVAPTGTDLKPVREAILSSFSVYGYVTHDVKISRLLAGYYDVDVSDKPEHERIRTLMNLGDKFRAEFSNGDAAVRLVANRIRQLRSELTDTEDGLVGSQVFLIDSLKNTAELRILDQIYGRNLYAISVFCDHDARRERIARRIAEKAGVSLNSTHLSLAEEVINEDQDRGNPALSQDVVNTFPFSDFFVNSATDVDSQIKRFVDLMFGAPFITPNVDEFGMFLAKAAAYRSCDLSRQVGASIVDDLGSVLATGCNEVPVPNGGFYFEGRRDAFDNRDHVKGFDPNYHEIQEAVLEILKSMKDENLLSERVHNQESEVLAASLLHGELRHVLKGTRLRSLIEFGRVVHAEMHAITDAARRGIAIGGKTLYCTTFPCHMCARHIIASGLKRVVYIEPYPKSLANKLYGDDISTGLIGTEPKENTVQFSPFMGVAPTLFQRIFDHRSGKTSVGTAAQFDKTVAKPSRAVPGVARLKLEKLYSSLNVSAECAT